MDQKSLNVKIINLDLAQKVDNENGGMSSIKLGNMYYIPPEMIKREKYSLEKAQVWELGVVLYNLLFNGEFPFSNHRETLKNDVSRIIDDSSMRYTRFWNKRDQNFLALMMSKSPSSRPTFDEILGHFYSPSNDDDLVADDQTVI